MRKSKMFGLAAVLMLAISGVASASAFAVEAEFSPAPNVIKEVKSGAGELLGGPLPVKCTSDEGGEKGGKGGEVTTTKTGTFNALFLGCEAAIVGSCTGLADEVTGSVLSTGTFEAGYVLATGTKADEDPALKFNINPTHFSCGIVLAIVTGSVCGLISPSNKKVKAGEHYTVTIAGKEAKESFAKVKGGSLVECKLSEEENENKKAKQAFEKTTEEVFLEKESELKA